MPSQFRVRAKTFIITYPQVNNGDDQHEFDSDLQETPGNYREFAESRLGDICCARFGREHHEDGGIHYHMFIGLSEATTIRSPDWLDYLGKHPNIKSVRYTPGTVWDYVGKEGDICYEFGERPGMGNDSGDNRQLKRTRDDAFREALSSTSKEEFLEKLKEMAPRDYVVCHGNIRAYAEWAYSPEQPGYEPPAYSWLDVNVRERNQLLVWADENLRTPLSGRR